MCVPAIHTTVRGLWAELAVGDEVWKEGRAFIRALTLCCPMWPRTSNEILGYETEVCT